MSKIKVKMSLRNLGTYYKLGGTDHNLKRDDLTDPEKTMYIVLFVMYTGLFCFFCFMIYKKRLSNIKLQSKSMLVLHKIVIFLLIFQFIAK